MGGGKERNYVRIIDDISLLFCLAKLHWEPGEAEALVRRRKQTIAATTTYLCQGTAPFLRHNIFRCQVWQRQEVPPRKAGIHKVQAGL